MQHSLFRKLALLLTLCFSFSLMLVPVTQAQTPQPNQGNTTIVVEPELQKQLQSNQQSGYLIYLRAKPDLSAAASMPWNERGKFVAEQLQKAAQLSQAPILDYLKAHGAAYKAFWVDNIIAVDRSDQTTFNGLLRFNGIEALRARREVFLIDGEDDPAAAPAAPNAPAAVESNLTHIQVPDAWALGYTGQGIVVANIDTGVRYTHQALVSHYRGNLGGGNFDHNYSWWDPYDGSTSPNDSQSHGSHTMGTMVGDDGGTNQIGVAPGAQWIACQGFNPSATDAGLLECAQWVLAPWDLTGANPDATKRPNIVNNSWGDCGQSYDGWYQSVLDNWHASGIYPVFSNGNASNCGYSSPPGLNTVGNPGRYGNVTGVGSTGTNNGQYANHSNWGPTDNADTVNPRGYPNLKPQVVAPGVSIRSSTHGSDTEYGTKTGTSMSAPHVVGLIALMWQAAPCLIGNYQLTETLLEQTATPIPYASNNGDEGPGNVPNHATGWGEINALNAVQIASGMCGPQGGLVGQVTNSLTSNPISGADLVVSHSITQTWNTSSDSSGMYMLTVPANTYTLTATKYGYITKVINPVVVTADMTTTLNIAMDPLPSALVSGTVTDSGHGWPLYARISVQPSGGPLMVVYTDPSDGSYSISLPQSNSYDFTVEAVQAGYAFQQRTVNLGTGNQTEDFVLAPDGNCSVPGYIKNDTELFSESFDGTTLPVGWSNIDNQGNGQVWQFNDPGAESNLTGGSGNFAIIDSDNYGSSGLQNTELRTPAIDASGASGVLLMFNTDYRDLSGDPEVADVDVSSDGVNWTNVWQKTTNYRGPHAETVDLSAVAANQPSVIVRFHYYNASWSWWWEVDDVRIINRTCTPADAGLLIGFVTDDNTGLPINGAAITNTSTPGQTTTSMATPNDDNISDGFYSMVITPSGTINLQATATNYAPSTQSVSVAANDVTVRPLPLSAAYVHFQGNMNMTVAPDTQHSFPTQMVNSGAVSTTVSLTEATTGVPGDVPWLALSATTMDINANATAPFDVQIDTTGMAEGVYQAQVWSSYDLPSPYSATVMTVTLTVANTTLQLDTPTTTLMGDPGSTVSFSAYVTNTGATTDTIDVALTGATWNFTPSSTQVGPLGPGAGTMITVDALIPASALSGASDSATLTVTSQNDAQSTASATLTAVANTVYGVDLSGQTLQQSGMPSTTVTYTLMLQNTGNTTDTFDIALSGAAWSTSSDQSSVMLAAGASTMIEVYVSIPGSAANSDSDSATVTVTSQADNSTQAEVTLTTSVGATQYRSFIPVLLK